MADIDQALQVAKAASNNAGNADNLSQQAKVTSVDTITPLDNLSQTVYSGKATTSDTTALRVPIIYGEVFTRGLSIDGATVINGSSDLFSDRTFTRIMSEAPTNGIVTTKENHVVINKRPLQDPTTSEIILRGVKVKDINSGIAYTATDESGAGSMTKISDESDDVNLSILNGTGKVDKSALQINTLQGLDDISGDAVNRVVPIFDSNANRFRLLHINDILQDVGMYIGNENTPDAETYPQKNWFLEHAANYEVTFDYSAGDVKSASQVDRFYKHLNTTSNATGVVDPALKINGVINPDIVMFRGETYQFAAGDVAQNGSGFDNHYRFYISDEVTTSESGGTYYGVGYTTNSDGSINALTGDTYIEVNEKLQFTPNSDTPDVLYYHLNETSSGSTILDNAQGRILVKDL